MEKKIIDISWGTLWRVFALVVFITIFIIARQAFFAFFLAIVFASAIDPIISFFEKRKFPRILVVLMIFIVCLAILAVLLYTIIPIAAIEFKNFISHLEESLPSFLQPAGSFQLLLDLSKGQENLINALLSGKESLMAIASQIFGNVVLLIVVFVLTFYLAVNKNGVENFFKAILPAKYEGRVIDVYSRINKKWGHWLQAQLFLSTIVGSLTFLGLWFLGGRYSLLLGVTAGIFDLVPMAGPIIAGTIAVFLAFSNSWTLAIYVAILFIVIQQFEAQILMPLVMKKTIGVNPAIVILSLLAGYAIASWVGVLLAVPVAVTIQEITEDLSRRKTELAVKE